MGKERGSKAWMATTVPTKGMISGKFSSDRCLELIEEHGNLAEDILVNTEQEAAIKSLSKDRIDSRGQGKTMPEESPKKSSGSHGMVERGVQEVENRIRAMLLGPQDPLANKNRRSA